MKYTPYQTYKPGDKVCATSLLSIVAHAVLARYGLRIAGDGAVDLDAITGP